jgi:hypothetical protein
MPDPRNDGENWSPPPVDAGSQHAQVDAEVRPNSDLGINVKVEPSSYPTTWVERMEKAIKLVSSTTGGSGPGSAGRSYQDAYAAGGQ